MKTIILFTILILNLSVAMAQNPFSSIGVKDKDVKVLTLSNGKYEEFEKYNRYQRVGSVVMDMQTMKIAYFIDRDTLRSEATLEPEVVSRWLSMDPLAAKFPNMSPYNFVANNPIMLIDPGGKFPISTHKNIFTSIMGNATSLKNMKTSDILKGIGEIADYPLGLGRGSFLFGLGGDERVHFDNMNGDDAFEKINANWNYVNKNLSEASKNGDGKEYGVNLHAVQDFYSHSNYVELYIDYYKSQNNGSSKDLDVNSIPTFDEMNNDEQYKDFKKICQNKLKTGNDNDRGEYTHKNLNLDKSRKGKGAETRELKGGEKKLSKIAEAVATKDAKSKIEKTNQ